MNKLLSFVKKEIVLCVAGVLAIASAFVVHPSKAYMNYIDFRVLALLFSLMLMVEALRSFGIFTLIIEKMTEKIKKTRMLYFILVFICFFSGMIITNDVALITFVPFAIELLTAAGAAEYIIYIVVLQTIGANLGSMATPIGNPQNIFLFSKYDMTMGEFAGATIWYAVTAIVLISICICFIPSKEIKIKDNKLHTAEFHKWKLIPVAVIFIMCILCVLRVADYRVMLLVCILLTAVVDYKLFAKADYMLLLTFVAFFILTGNIKSMSFIENGLSDFVAGRELMSGILLSQVISNVPAAVLLSNFTDKGTLLLSAVNIGGLGTVIASMASLISFRYYGESKDSKKGRYLGVFTLFNLGFLGIMLLVSRFI